jgi:cytochrome b6
MNKVYDWFEERLEVQAIADDISSKYVPPHVNIFYCFGGLVLTCFLIQVATGFAMTFITDQVLLMHLHQLNIL